MSLTEEPKLAKLQKTAGGVPTFNAIRAMLVSLSANLHIANGLTESNINSIARRLTTDPAIIWWLTLADVDLLCRKIVDGDYGNFFGHFGVGEFNDCLLKYCNERNEIHAIQNEKTVSADPAVLEDIGYTVDEHGNIKTKGERRNFPQPQYLYDDHGRRCGTNPKWENPNKKDPTKMSAAMRLYRLAADIADMRKITFAEALEVAKNEVQKQ